MVAKLSKAQSEIVDLMRKGWELGMYISYGSGNSVLQQDGIGYGGKVKKVSSATVWALHRQGIIYIAKESFPVRIFKLKTAYK